MSKSVSAALLTPHMLRSQGGEPHILDSVRDVVALHRDRVVFPLQLCVTKLSGIGT